MRLSRSCQLGAAVLTAYATHGICATFSFDPSTYDAEGLYSVLNEHYYQYASIWESQLSLAKVSYTSAYPVLTSIYNTDHIPPTPEPTFLSNLAEEMIKIGTTQVIDPGADASTLSESKEHTSATSESEKHTPTLSESEEHTSATSHRSDTDHFSLSSDKHDTESSAAAPNARPAAALCGIAAALAIAVSSCIF